jgi:hypothetical protein
LDMTATSSVPWSATTIPPWRRSTRLILKLNIWILLPICFLSERLWTQQHGMNCHLKWDC